MKISYNWLKQFIEIEEEIDKISEILTDLGLEVEGVEKIESIKGSLEGIVVGKVLTCEKHPQADKLKLTTVNIGDGEPLQIVCGAPNVAAGQTVPVATIGTVLYDEDGSSFKIKKSKLRGEASYGMICAEDELGLGKSHDGILVLQDTLDAGLPLNKVYDVEVDYVFEIGLTPNRSDAMSHFGVARDLRAGLLQKGIKTTLVTPSVSDFHVDDRTNKVDIEVENYELTPRYTGITITDVTVGDSPTWLQNKLKAIGLAPINNVVDITNYVMHSIGQPLHAFDANKIGGRKVVVKCLPKETPFITLDGVERKLHEEDIMICDANDKPMCIAGVFGGINSGISNDSTSVFLESAYFDSVSIRKTAKRHQLNTDASFRFERGIDINETKYALRYAAMLIKEICGGKITSEITDLYPIKSKNQEIVISFANINQLIGQEIPVEKIVEILVSLDFKVNSQTNSNLGLVIPSYRVDVTREADVIEEILRVYGYNNVALPEKLNTSIPSFNKFDTVRLENIAADYLVALGFYEIMSNSLTKESYLELQEDFNKEHNVTILNPLSKDLAVMRQSLLFNGLEAIAYNNNRKNKNLKFFELGNTYHTYSDRNYTEDKHLALFATGNEFEENWLSTNNNVSFFYLKGIVLSILERFGIKQLKENPTKSSVFSEGIALVKKKTILVNIGVVKASISKKFGIKQEVLFADFNWKTVLEYLQKDNFKVTTLPKYPSVKRDLALLIEDKVSFKQIYNIAYQTEQKLLKDIQLFDVYTGDKLPKGKKSYAVSFILQDSEKTLNDKQIDKIMTKLQASFEKQVNAELR